MKTHLGRLVLSFAFALPAVAAAAQGDLQLNARTRVELPDGSFAVTEKNLKWAPEKTAIVVCDMWDKHWCEGATRRVAEMAPRMNEVIREARKRGVFIIHCPSDTMDFYEGWPQRKRAQNAPVAEPKVPLQHWCHLDPENEASLPIDDSDGGCDDQPQCRNYKAWTRQIETIEIAPEDAITDSAEAYYLMQDRGIENVIVMGVHVNMCVLGRPFSIRQMIYQGKSVVLMRDLTDSMYNSRRSPYVNHFRGTELVVEHIEKYWCPSVTSADFVGGRPFRFNNDSRPQAVFMIGEEEYNTAKTLPEFAREVLEERGIDCTFAHVSKEDPNDFPGLEKLKEADLLVLSVRRRTPPERQLSLVRRHLDAGKPLVAIRTASHAFDAKPPDEAHGRWEHFDTEILGMDYQRHYGNKPPEDPPTVVRIAEGESDHPILTGLQEGPFEVTSHLYKNRDPAPSVTVLMEGRVKGEKMREPVAWINEPQNTKVFATSLGSPEDFEETFFRRLLMNGILWALDQPIPPKEWDGAARVTQNSDSTVSNESSRQEGVVQTNVKPEKPAGPFSPEESLNAFHVSDGLVIEQVLAEPIVRQPVFLNFDERGRMWVVQYIQYPEPAGLTMVSRDKYWRAVYDKVPPPPPNHFHGRDKITVHEDSDGDGSFDTHKTFLDGLNIVTAVARGRGGVWILNPPYLLFYPDSNGDDVPDTDPVVHLSGFGLEDTHSVVNSLRWGPDGWLYAAQGSTVTAQVVRPGLETDPRHSMGQLIWRYHPETRRYEVFAEGGGNAFGVEIDSKGRIFSGHNGGDTRGFHYVQGGYLRKGFSKHGPLSNPYAFGYFEGMKHHPVERFTHTFVIYEGGGLPDFYDRKLWGAEPLQGRIVLSDFFPNGSSFQTRDLERVVTTEDEWFRPVDIKVGPDGALYIADWYDQQVNHYQNHEGRIDKERGRIYRVRAKGEEVTQGMFDLGALSAEQLLPYLYHPNKWWRQTALRLLADRRDPSVVPDLKEKVGGLTGQIALDAFWAVNLCGGFDDEFADRTLSHPDPYVRLWTVRLLGDRKEELSDELIHRLIAMAASERHSEVRSQLGCTARRLPAEPCLAIVMELMKREVDTTDIYQPLILWWALESKAGTARDQVLGLFEEAAFWEEPLVQEHILERLIKRYAMPGTRRDWLACARLFEFCPNKTVAKRLLTGFEKAMQGRSMGRLPEELVAALDRFGEGSLVLDLRRKKTGALDRAMEVIRTRNADPDPRIQLIQVLGEMDYPDAVEGLLETLRQENEEPVRKAILTSLMAYDAAEIGDEVVSLLPKMPSEVQKAALNLLLSRNSWAIRLLKEIEAGNVASQEIPREFYSRFAMFEGEPFKRLLQKNLPEAISRDGTTDWDARMAQYERMLEQGIGDPYRGKPLFAAACGACHKLFGEGGEIGPDLSSYQRSDLDNLLLSIVHPNAEIREGFENFTVETKDGRTVTGFLADQDLEVIILRGLDAQNVVLKRKEIDSMKPAGKSLMPEGLLVGLTDQEVRDLFAYLRSSQPLNE